MNKEDFINAIKVIFLYSKDDELSEKERLQQIADFTFEIISLNEK